MFICFIEKNYRNILISKTNFYIFKLFLLKLILNLIKININIYKTLLKTKIYGNN